LIAFNLSSRQNTVGPGSKGSDRVIRGGSWINNARNARSAYRNWNDPGNRNNNLGFRLLNSAERVGTDDFWLNRSLSFPRTLVRGENELVRRV
jgi:Sulfatase-modifying factor enzyme 1